MDKLIEMQDYFASLTADSSLSFLINVVLAIVLSSILSKFFLVYGNSYSDRKPLANTFVVLTLTTLFVISVVKSSLALSLGLVGALSIVRFRTPIKEPEELVYIFISIAIGLGLGANSRGVTIIMVSAILLFIYWKNNHTESFEKENITLVIEHQDSSNEIRIDDLISIIKKYSNRVELSRFQTSTGLFEVQLYIEIGNYLDIEKIRKDLLRHKENLELTFVDSSSAKLL